MRELEATFIRMLEVLEKKQTKENCADKCFMSNLNSGSLKKTFANDCLAEFMLDHDKSSLTDVSLQQAHKLVRDSQELIKELNGGNESQESYRSKVEKMFSRRSDGLLKTTEKYLLLKKTDASWTRIGVLRITGSRRNSMMKECDVNTNVRTSCGNNQKAISYFKKTASTR